jgi:hypothetical protein
MVAENSLIQVQATAVVKIYCLTKPLTYVIIFSSDPEKSNPFGSMFYVTNLKHSHPDNVISPIKNEQDES